MQCLTGSFVTLCLRSLSSSMAESLSRKGFLTGNSTQAETWAEKQLKQLFKLSRFTLRSENYFDNSESQPRDDIEKGSDELLIDLDLTAAALSFDLFWFRQSEKKTIWTGSRSIEITALGAPSESFSSLKLRKPSEAFGSRPVFMPHAFSLTFHPRLVRRRSEKHSFLVVACFEGSPLERQVKWKHRTDEYTSKWI